MAVCTRPFASDFPAAGHQFAFCVGAEQVGNRLDQFLARLLADASRSLISESIRLGLVTVNGQLRKSSYLLKADESVVGSLRPAPVMALVPEKIPFEILFEDESLLVISKPPGLVVHPGSGNHTGTLVQGLLYHCQAIADVGDEAGLRPGIVHRLDKDTSGVMVVAKEESAHRKLVEAFQARAVAKHYIALAQGIPAHRSGRIAASLGRHPVHRQKMCLREDGRFAVTNWQILQEFSSSSLSLLRLHIETGRTHQIRAHLASIGHPVAGDQLYGGSKGRIKFPRQMLHSAQLAFIHPCTGQELVFTAPLWPDFLAVLDQLEDDCGADQRSEKGKS
jgi:23S rRNA pseudouridine1911/1915/1917 synthase